MRSSIAFSDEKINEDLAIAITEPKVAMEDFWPFARALRRFLLDQQVVEGPEEQQGVKRSLEDNLQNVTDTDDELRIISKAEATLKPRLLIDAEPTR
ncbi:unnamed protein product [Urochloa humidicola]